MEAVAASRPAPWPEPQATPQQACWATKRRPREVRSARSNGFSNTALGT